MKGSDSESAVAAGLARALEKEGGLTWEVQVNNIEAHLQLSRFYDRLSCCPETWTRFLVVQRYGNNQVVINQRTGELSGPKGTAEDFYKEILKEAKNKGLAVMIQAVCSPKLMDHLQSKGFRPRNSLNEFNADFVFCVKCDTLKGTEF